MDFWQVFILALLQGFTEFLPISSSAHLILVPVLTEWTDQGLAFDVAVHAGTLAAVVLYFRRELVNMAREWGASLRGGIVTRDAKLGWWVLIGTVPVGLAGLVFHDVIADDLRSPLVIAGAFIGFGLVLSWADWRHRGARDEYSLSLKDVLVIGIAQALALIPGTSRSGITMTAALMLGMNREATARFSFLLSVPVIVLAGGMEMLELARAEVPADWNTLLLGTVLAGVSAYLCIHYFLMFIQRIGMQPFVIYRIAIGAVLLYLYL